MSDGPTVASVEETAERLGIVDALLFRRLSASTWAHLGGLGRGRGWAGVVDVSTADDPLLSLVPARPGDVQVLAAAQPTRVLGPYYAVGAALVRVSHDVMVVFGNAQQALSEQATEPELRALADRLETSVDDVAPSKRLGDELEVLHAVRAVTTGDARDLNGTLRHVVEVAVEWLSCEIGLLRDGNGRFVCTSSWPGVEVDDPEVAAALDALEERARESALCVQDSAEAVLPAALSRERGVRSLLAVPIPAPVGGVLVVAHTDARPRGFTTLCQQLGEQVAEAAGLVAHTAALREELRTIAEKHFRTARRDPLTGLGNRLAWDEALSAAQEQVDAGGSVTIVTLDVDGLKIVNDTYGHEAGDALLRRCAEVLREHGRDSDVAVRLGGDEFAMILPMPAHLVRDRLASIRDQLSGTTSCQRIVAASVGSATARHGGSVADAAREADAAMYADKRARRAAIVSTPA